MSADTVIPITLFGGTAVVLGLFFYFRYKARVAQHKTIRFALEKGQELSPELIEAIGKPNKPPKDRDLRRALISFAIGFGFLALAFGIPEDDAFGPMVSVASFPILIGLAFLIMHKFGAKED